MLLPPNSFAFCERKHVFRFKHLSYPFYVICTFDLGYKNREDVEMGHHSYLTSFRPFKHHVAHFSQFYPSLGLLGKEIKCSFKLFLFKQSLGCHWFLCFFSLAVELASLLSFYTTCWIEPRGPSENSVWVLDAQLDTPSDWFLCLGTCLGIAAIHSYYCISILLHK